MIFPSGVLLFHSNSFWEVVWSQFVWFGTTEERVEKEHGKTVPSVHLEAVGNITQTDEQFQKAEVIQEIGFHCTISYWVHSKVFFMRTCLNMQSFHFCCYGDEYLLSRIASAVSSPGVVQRNQSVSCHTVSLTPHCVSLHTWCFFISDFKNYILHTCASSQSGPVFFVGCLSPLISKGYNFLSSIF